MQTNAYDGRHYRTIRNDYTAGALSETRHYFYTAAWQSVEERVGKSTSPDRQFVYGLKFIDDLVLRDRDSNGGGTLDERVYALQDPLGSVVAIVKSCRNHSRALRLLTVRSSIVSLGSSFRAESGTLFGWSMLFASYAADLKTWLYIV